MINLLPPQQKKELLKEKKFKVILILVSIFLIFLICLFLLFYSINIFISGELAAQKTILNRMEEELRAPPIKSLEENLINFNQTLFQLNSFYQSRLNFSQVLEKIAKTLPDEVFLEHLSIALAKNISLSGFSPQRESLLKFKENLEKESSLTKIFFPPTNWVKNKDINFSASLEIEK